MVHTNDPETPTVDLHVKGFVEKFVTLSPRVVNIRGAVGAALSSSVRIIPEKKYPFTIKGSRAKDGKHISFKLKKEEKGYLLTVENMKKEKGRYFDTILLTTDSKISPEIRINVFGNIMDPNSPKVGNTPNQKSFIEVIRKLQEENARKNGGQAPPAAASSQENQEKVNDFLKVIQQQQAKQKAAQ